MQTLISYRGVKTTKDLKEGIARLENRLSKVKGVKLKISSCDFTPLSKAGREIELRVVSKVFTEEQCNLLLWGNAIPCGFTPFDRYPNLGLPQSNVFHFFGVWQVLFDTLCSEGRGEYAWDSLCCAALCDVNQWLGDKPRERYLQTQLYRLGYPCGVVDGLMSEQVQTALRALGLQSMSLEEKLEYLSAMKSPKRAESERKYGHLVLPDIPHRVYSYGSVNTTKTIQGVSVAAEGSGRIVIDIL